MGAQKVKKEQRLKSDSRKLLELLGAIVKPEISTKKAEQDKKKTFNKKAKQDNKTYYNKKSSVGRVISSYDSIVIVSGCYNAQMGELLTIVTPKNNVRCLVLNLEKDQVRGVILENSTGIKTGQYVYRTETLMSVPTHESMLGRVIDPLGNPIDGQGKLLVEEKRFVENGAAPIIDRSPINQQVVTGLKVVDSLVPIGHGQRELIIGDSKTGKTSIAIDSILNQVDNDTICIYVAIGQKRSSVGRIVKLLSDFGSLKSTIIVAATASDSAAMQYLAPYSGVSIGEYFMLRGLPVLIVYDDLSKHAVSYRQLSLLLRRPPGREGYPGDVFYLHSRLLERAAKLKTVGNRSGSITALPIIETIQGDVSAYIPTNVISITDGQIYLEMELFSRGIRPAVSPGLSVSRVGSAAQNKLLKNLSGSLKLELAQFQEVENFAKLGFALDEATEALIKNGTMLTTVLVQNRYKPYSVVEEIMLFILALGGFLGLLPQDILYSFPNSFEYFEKLYLEWLEFCGLYSLIEHGLKQLNSEILTYIAHCYTATLVRLYLI